MNLCTDQLAMLVAAPGQLVAVSELGRDPHLSAMAEARPEIPTHGSQAEEIFALRPDLVIAGSFTARPAVEMLKRLGLRVVDMPPEQTLDDVAAHLREMGRLLGQESRAEELASRFESDLAALTVPAATPRPQAVVYGPNGYSAGPNSLAGQVLELAGYDNLAAKLGLSWGGQIPLERLIMAEPDLMITGGRYAGGSRSEALLDHPALSAIPRARVPEGSWSCGTPYILGAIRALSEARP
ncbi:ABC transporter substrate-binding protein [Mesobacterium pallidum]|uniref:ABC transporter substrate-binding protein n=1 Tax=Mesobacterium pallidum TaxID=2872037 RepID=UPI001EE38123|nr:ABC transporter substrate-binding protein [Mesobacterium pallidum]